MNPYCFINESEGIHMLENIMNQLNPHQKIAFQGVFLPREEPYKIKDKKFDISKRRSIIMSRTKDNITIKEADIIARILNEMNVMYDSFVYRDYDEFKNICNKVGRHDITSRIYERVDNICIYGRQPDFFYGSENDIDQLKEGEPTTIAVIEYGTLNEIVNVQPDYRWGVKRDYNLTESRVVDSSITLRIFYKEGEPHA